MGQFDLFGTTTPPQRYSYYRYVHSDASNARLLVPKTHVRPVVSYGTIARDLVTHAPRCLFERVRLRAVLQGLQRRGRSKPRRAKYSASRPEKMNSMPQSMHVSRT